MPRRWAVWFTVEGDLRFLSHRNVMSLMERASGRARLPLRYSQGFNPRPKLSLPLPRPVGVASRCELLVLEFDREFSEDVWAEGLAEQFPGDAGIFRTEPLPEGRKARVKAVTYELALEGPDRLDVSAGRIDARLASLKRSRLDSSSDGAVSNGPADGPADGEAHWEDMRDSLEKIDIVSGRLCFTIKSKGADVPAGPARLLRLLGLCRADKDEQPASAACAEALAKLTRTAMECEF